MKRLVEFTLYDRSETIWINPDAIVTVRAHHTIQGATNITVLYSPESISGRTILVVGEADRVAAAININMT